MGELQSAIDALAAEDLFALSAPEVLDETALLVQARNRIDAQLARRARHGDATQAAEHDGKASMASWLRGHCRLSNAAIGQLKRTGRAMEHLPTVAAACADGSITAEQVAVISPIVSPENLERAGEQNIDLADIDRVFADVAATQQHA